MSPGPCLCPVCFTCKWAFFGEPTSGLEPLTCSLRVIGQALQGFAQGCKCRISTPVSLLRLALRCTVLRSRWCQSGVRSSWITRRRFLCARQASSNGDGLPATGRVHARLPCAMGTGYLDAVLGRDLQDPPYVWLVLKDARPRLTVHRLTDLLEEPLVRAPRTPPHLGTSSVP